MVVVDELFMMTNLFPEDTGLPMVIWIGPSYGATHNICIKVSQHHGDQMDPNDIAVIELQDQPNLISGHLSPDDLGDVRQWIALKETVIKEHWNGLTSCVGLSNQLRSI